MSLDWDPSLFEFEPETGEFFTDGPIHGRRFPRRTFQAVHKRLGNISAIGYLRDLISGLLPADSIVLARILYSGTHCADYIGLEDVGRLRAELETVRRLTARGRAPELDLFLSDMQELADAAERERNPIVFT